MVLGLASMQMTLAFVMINSVPDQSEWVLKRIEEVKGVEDAYRVFGVYDIVAVVRPKTPEELQGIVLRIRSVEYVKSTLTLVVVK